MDQFSYNTIQSPSQGAYREKGSKFLGFAYPVESEEDIKIAIERLKKEYFDARHHCFAWILGPDGKRFRAFDDGEPNHSAGDPILGQIRSRQLTNVLVVVVRYFGGVKLGVGGLISAYRIAAQETLAAAQILEKEISVPITLSFTYPILPDIMRLVKEFELSIVHQDFREACVITLDIPLRVNQRVLERIDLMKAMGSAIISS